MGRACKPTAPPVETTRGAVTTLLDFAVTSACWYLTVKEYTCSYQSLRTDSSRQAWLEHIRVQAHRGRTSNAAPPPRGPIESCPAGSGPGPRRAAFWSARHGTVRHAAAGRHRPYLMVPKLGWDCRHAADAGQVRHSDPGIPNQAKVTGAGCSPPTGGTAPRPPVRRSAPFRT